MIGVTDVTNALANPPLAFTPLTCTAMRHELFLIQSPLGPTPRDRIRMLHDQSVCVRMRSPGPNMVAKLVAGMLAGPAQCVDSVHEVAMKTHSADLRYLTHKFMRKKWRRAMTIRRYRSWISRRTAERRREARVLRARDVDSIVVTRALARRGRRGMSIMSDETKPLNETVASATLRHRTAKRKKSRTAVRQFWMVARATCGTITAQRRRSASTWL